MFKPGDKVKFIKLDSPWEQNNIYTVSKCEEARSYFKVFIKEPNKFGVCEDWAWNEWFELVEEAPKEVKSNKIESSWGF